jgi:iron complex outermembrane receptor protein
LLGKWRHTLKIDKGKLQLLISGQQNNRKEYDIVRSSSNTKPQMDLQIATLNQELLIEKSPNKKTDIQIGLNAMQQQNTYTGRYFIPNFRAFSGGLFGLIKWSNTIWDIHSGFRIDNKYVNTSRLLLAGDTVSNRFNFTTSGASFFVQYKPPIAHDLVWSVQIGLNSRAPHVNELLSNGIHHGTATYEQGNTSLKPEKSSVMQTKVMYENHDHTLHAEVNGSFQLVRDFIYMTPQPDSPVLTNAGAFPRMVYRQTDARLLGADVLISLKLLKGLSSQLQGSTIRAYDLKQSTWLIMMPADRISNMLKYEFNFKKTLHDAYFSLEALHVWRQGRIPDPKSAIVDYKAPPDAYTLFHLHASATFHLGKHPVTAGFSLRNLLNTTYRDYLNQLRYFIDEPGRNLQIRIKYVIENTKNKNT